MLGFLKNIDWSALIKSKAVWTGLGTTIVSVSALAGYVIDPDQLESIITNLQIAATAITAIAGVCSMIFRVKAETRILKPSPNAPPQKLQPKQ